MIRYNEPQKSYEIIGIYADVTETLDTVDSYKDAVYLSAEYQMNLGSAWEVQIRELWNYC